MMPLFAMLVFISLIILANCGEYFLSFDLIGSPSIVFIRIVQSGINPTGSEGVVINRALTDLRRFNILFENDGDKCERSSSSNIDSKILDLSSVEVAFGISGVNPFCNSFTG